MPVVNTWGNINTWSSIPAASISSISSNAGIDKISADNTFTITVNDSTSISSVYVNNVPCTNVSITNSTTVTATAPHGFDIDYGSSVDVIVYNGQNSTGYPVTVLQPEGMTETAFTVDYANLSPNSPFYNNSAFSSIVVGDSCIYDSVTNEDSIAVTMSGNGDFTLASVPTTQQTIDYFIFDTSDKTSGQYHTITIQIIKKSIAVSCIRKFAFGSIQSLKWN